LPGVNEKDKVADMGKKSQNDLAAWIAKKKADGLSFTEIGVLLGVKKSMVSLLLSGKRKPGGSSLKRYAKATGIPVERLLS
jgi:transcriptional regulator with XRE-family HTH domain